MIEHGIKKGLTTTYTKKTTTNDAYAPTNEATLDYLVSTPAMMCMAIDAATEMLDGRLPQDYITVGKKIDLIHEHPSIVGDDVTLKLVVDNVEGHVISLLIEVKDSIGVICTGTYQRVIIQKAKLLEIAHQRTPGLL